MHNSTYVYAPGHGNYHFGAEKNQKKDEDCRIKM